MILVAESSEGNEIGVMKWWDARYKFVILTAAEASAVSMISTRK